MSPIGNGVQDVVSHRAVADTLDRLQALAIERGLRIFSRIDFGADAAQAGVALRRMQMLLFGNPKAGSPLLAAAPRTGLDLPLKALAWEDAEGVVRVSYNAPEYIQNRHGLTPALTENIAGVRALIEKACEQ